jgi:hypothetical protein
MRRAFRKVMLLMLLAAMPGTARAGWVSDWTSTAVKQNGDRMDPQSSSMSVAGGHVRLEQPEILTLIDYNASTFTLANSTKEVFWSGSIDDYVQQIAASRALGLRQKLGGVEEKSKKAQELAQKALSAAKVDPAKLPPVSIVKTDVTEKIAGYDTVKYECRAAGDLFQEIWVAPGLDMSSDLDVDRYLAMQRQLSASMLGKTAPQFNALYRDDEYRKLLQKATVLKMVTHHIGGSFERVATAVRQTDIAPSQFTVPASYRKVKLSDVLEPAPAAQPPAQPPQK